MKNIVIALIIIAVGIAVSGIILMNKDTEKIANAEEIFLDVRTEEEWNESHVEGAVFFELARLQNGEVPDLPKDAKIAIYCRSGNRAGQAKTILERNGFTDVRNAGGLMSLESQGMKVCSGKEPSC